MTVLSTARLTLTPVAVGDMDDLTALWADAEFTRHIMGRGLSEEEVWFRLLRDIGAIAMPLRAATRSPPAMSQDQAGRQAMP